MRARIRRSETTAQAWRVPELRPRQGEFVVVVARHIGKNPVVHYFANGLLRELRHADATHQKTLKNLGIYGRGRMKLGRMNSQYRRDDDVAAARQVVRMDYKRKAGNRRPFFNQGWGRKTCRSPFARYLI